MNTLGTIHTSGDTYRKQWALLTGRSEREVYIPLALRTTEPDPGPLPKPDPVPWPGPPPTK